jgi:hypothetical protein
MVGLDEPMFGAFGPDATFEVTFILWSRGLHRGARHQGRFHVAQTSAASTIRLRPAAVHP